MVHIIKKIFNFFGFDLKRKRLDYGINIYKENYIESDLENKNFYNVGAGNFIHPYWTNIDYRSDWYKEDQGEDQGRNFINFNLFSNNKLPIIDNSAKCVYTSHTIEHIDDQAAQNLFNEAYRILDKGGVFRITTPNIELEYRACINDDRDYFYWINDYSKETSIKRIKITLPMNEASIQQIFIYHFAGQASTLHFSGKSEKVTDEEFKKIFSSMEFEDALNFCTSRCLMEVQLENPGNHINWWSLNKAKKMLEKSGFKSKLIFKSGYGQSFSPIMRDTNFFDNTHPKISLYVEAIKD